MPPQVVEIESLSKFVLWELRGIYGQRVHDPDTLTPYEMRNGINAEREEVPALLCAAHWKEDVNDEGRSMVTWLTLEEILRALQDSELSVLDHYFENHQSEKWARAREELRERFPEPQDDEIEAGG